MTMIEYFSRRGGPGNALLQPLHSQKFDSTKRKMGSQQILYKTVSDQSFKTMGKGSRHDLLENGKVSHILFGGVHPGFDGVEIDLRDPGNPVLICYEIKWTYADSMTQASLPVTDIYKKYKNFLKHIEPHLGLRLLHTAFDDLMFAA